MIMGEIAVANIVKSVVPISRFNKGEASKIFNEVIRDGVKVVMKNNDPSCVLVSVERYIAMENMIENYQLADEAKRREKVAKGKELISQSEIMTRYGISDEELDADVEIE